MNKKYTADIINIGGHKLDAQGMVKIDELIQNGNNTLSMNFPIQEHPTFGHKYFKLSNDLKIDESESDVRINENIKNLKICDTSKKNFTIFQNHKIYKESLIKQTQEEIDDNNFITMNRYEDNFYYTTFNSPVTPIIAFITSVLAIHS